MYLNVVGDHLYQKVMRKLKNCNYFQLTFYQNEHGIYQFGWPLACQLLSGGLSTTEECGHHLMPVQWKEQCHKIQQVVLPVACATREGGMYLSSDLCPEGYGGHQAALCCQSLDMATFAAKCTFDEFHSSPGSAYMCKHSYTYMCMCMGRRHWDIESKEHDIFCMHESYLAPEVVLEAFCLSDGS